MCVVSAIHDYGMRQPDEWWTRPRYHEFEDLVKKGHEFDIKTSQPHCEDPEKVALMKRIEDRLAAIEALVKASEEPAPAEPEFITLEEAHWGNFDVVASQVRVIDLATGEAPVDPAGVPYNIVRARADEIIVMVTVNDDDRFYGLGSPAGANTFMRIDGRFESRYPKAFLS